MKAVNPPFCLSGSRLRASAHPFQFPAVQRPALPLCGKHHFFTRRTVFQIDFVIAFVAVKPAACQLQNHICDPIQEVAVVRYHEDRATELFQVVFQPFDRVAVDVVRRLVQNQNITFIRENPCHGNAFSLATRQGAHFLLKIRNPKLIQHGFAFIFTLFRSREILVFPIRTLPEVGFSSPASCLRRVDFPVPLTPMSPILSPSFIAYERFDNNGDAV